jgi:alkylated DNA repair protein alkB family protein 8
MPEELTWLINHFIYSGVFGEDQRPQYCIINEYVSSQGISAHVKAALAAKTGRKEDVLFPRRSLCVMRGDSRWKWQHEIVRSGKGRGVGWERVSLTFRSKV